MTLVEWNFNQVMEITFIKHLFMNLCLYFFILKQNNLLDQKKNKTFVSKQSQKLCYMLEQLCGILPHLLLLIKTFYVYKHKSVRYICICDSFENIKDHTFQNEFITFNQKLNLSH